MVPILTSRTRYSVVQYIDNHSTAQTLLYQEEKSPIDLATELNNTEILNLLTDFKQNGQAALIKYKRSNGKKNDSAQV